MGRRRYSWERGQSRRQSQPEPEPTIAGGIAGVLMILFLSYVIFRPLFWVLAIVFGFIAALFAFAGALMLWEKLSKPRPTPLWIDEKNAPNEKAIGQRAKPCVAESASDISKEVHMTHDTRLALIDSDGDTRFPAIINGTFQIGKGRDELPTRIEDFARAILIDEKDGRFVCADGRKPGILKFSGRAKEARSYRLDPTIAAQLGIPAYGNR